MNPENPSALARFDSMFQVVRGEALRALDQLEHTEQKTLYQYTSPHAFQKMVEVPRIWATDTRYLNDASELLYALDVVALLGKEMMSAAATDWSREFFAQVQIPRWYGPSGYDVFVACFSEEPDVLSQWRAYANDAAGYAVGIECTPGFQVVGSKDPVRLVRVIYTENEQKELLRPWMARIASLLDEMWVGRDPQSADIDIAIFGALLTLKMVVSELAVAMKNPGFAEEREWRLVFTCYGCEDITKFRPGRFGLTPYVEIDTGAKLPLQSVMRGPKLDSSEAHRSLFRFLSSRGFAVIGDNAVRLNKSQIAYR